MSVSSFIAGRYLRPRRGRGLMSVASAIATAGFAAGVAALILALAVTNGFRDTLQRELVGATSQVNLLRRDAGSIANYVALLQQMRRLPHVEAVAPAVYDVVFLSHDNHAGQATLKGILPRQELAIGDMLKHLQSGSLAPIAANPAARDLVLGRALADSLGVETGDYVSLYVPGAVLTPFGMTGRTVPFQVVGIFQSGYADFDSTWAYTGFRAAQELHPGMGDSASVIEFRLDNIYSADAVARAAEQAAGPQFTAITWITQNRPIFQALALERLGTLIVIGLVVLVAAFSVTIMLTMLVLEKRREIAVLSSMGARPGQIGRIFVFQGLAIAALGTGLGLLISFPVAWAANRYHLIHVSAAVYAVDYIPFHAHPLDGVLVAALALVISTLASLYPARRALQVTPAETLRYE